MTIQLQGVQLGNYTGGPVTINLENLNDVLVSSAQTGNYLRYNSTTSQWQNQTINYDTYQYLNTNLTSSNGIVLTKLAGPETIDIGLNLTVSGDASGTTSSGVINFVLNNVNSTTGVFGSSTLIPIITVNSKGLITNVSTTTFTGTAPSATNLSGGNTGDIVYQSATNTTAFLPPTDNTNVLVSGPTSPSWTNTPTLSGINFSNIPNTALNGNGIITLGTSSVSLGNSTPILSGMTSISSTNFYGSLTGNVTGTSTGNLLLSGGTLTGPLMLSADPTMPLGAATKQYVDAISSGLFIHSSALVATTIPLTATYNNGISGVGATLTNNAILGPLLIDNYTPQLNDRVLVKDQSNKIENGIYYVTTVGDSTTPWTLTRSTDADSSIPNNFAPGSFVFITVGTVNTNTGWVETGLGTNSNKKINVGIDQIIFTQFSGAGAYLPGTGLSLNGNTFTNTGVINLTAGANISITGTNNNLTIEVSGVVPGAVSSFTSNSTLALMGGAANEIVYQTAPNQTSFLAPGNTGQVLAIQPNGSLGWNNVVVTPTVLSLSSDTTLTTSQIGSVISVVSEGITITIPNPATVAGQKFTFNNEAGCYITSVGDIILGQQAGNTMFFNNGAAYELTSDGTSWLVTSYSGLMTFTSGRYGQLETINGSGTTWYNAGFRNDGGSAWLLSSDAQTTEGAAANAGSNSFRPFTWNLATGLVTIDGTGVGAQFGGSVSATTYTANAGVGLNVINNGSNAGITLTNNTASTGSSWFINSQSNGAFTLYNNTTSVEPLYITSTYANININTNIYGTLSIGLPNVQGPTVAADFISGTNHVKIIPNAATSNYNDLVQAGDAVAVYSTTNGFAIVPQDTSTPLSNGIRLDSLGNVTVAGNTTFNNESANNNTATVTIISNYNGLPPIYDDAPILEVMSSNQNISGLTFSGSDPRILAVGINTNGHLLIRASQANSNSQIDLYTNQLNISGNIAATGSIQGVSDGNVKTNWRSLNNKKFIKDWANVKRGIYDRRDIGATEVGMEAQSIQAVLPCAVKMGKNELLHVTKDNAAIFATGELAEYVVSLEYRISELEYVINKFMENT